MLDQYLFLANWTQKIQANRVFGHNFLRVEQQKTFMFSGFFMIHQCLGNFPRKFPKILLFTRILKILKKFYY